MSGELSADYKNGSVVHCPDKSGLADSRQLGGLIWVKDPAPNAFGVGLLSVAPTGLSLESRMFSGLLRGYEHKSRPTNSGREWKVEDGREWAARQHRPTFFRRLAGTLTQSARSENVALPFSDGGQRTGKLPMY